MEKIRRMENKMERNGTKRNISGKCMKVVKQAKQSGMWNNQGGLGIQFKPVEEALRKRVKLKFKKSGHE